MEEDETFQAYWLQSLSIVRGYKLIITIKIVVRLPFTII